MAKDYASEKWEKVHFDFVYTNSFRLEISNYGRLKSFTGLADGKIINGTMINGYRIIRLKLFKPREEKTHTKITRLQKQFKSFTKELKELIKDKAGKNAISEKEESLKSIRKQLKKVYKEDNRYRTINYQSLIHRLVAIYFLPKPSSDKIVVAHIDHDKLNNHVSNLKWMTRDENFKHQQNSPLVIQDKRRRESGMSNSKVAKLTVTKVMLLKKLLNQNKPVKQLIKQFKVTDMQIYRIKRGENWKNIPAAN